MALPAMGYDANGVALGAKEADVKKAFPAAHCQPLEWKSRAADRRCDDARISFGGIDAKLTVYLLGDAVQAFDVRFDARDIERMKTQLRNRYGVPLAEATEVVGQAGKADRKVYKARWEKGGDRAVLSAQLERKRATLEVSRGGFPEEIYRVR